MKLTLNPKRWLLLIISFFAGITYINTLLIYNAPPPPQSNAFQYTQKRAGVGGTKREEGKKTKSPDLIPGKFCSKRK